MTDAHNVDEGINAHLAEENERMRMELESAKSVAYNLSQQLQQRDELSKQIIAYLPQLTHISTNLSAVASAIQHSNNQLSSLNNQVANLTKQVARNRPTMPQLATQTCHCDGPPHAYAPPWCPIAGPVGVK